MQINDLVVEEVQTIVDLLGTLPFNKVSGLINKIVTQARAQLEAGEEVQHTAPDITQTESPIEGQDV